MLGPIFNQRSELTIFIPHNNGRSDAFNKQNRPGKRQLAVVVAFTAAICLMEETNVSFL